MTSPEGLDLDAVGPWLAARGLVEPGPLEEVEDWIIPFLSADFDAEAEAGAAVFAAMVWTLNRTKVESERSERGGQVLRIRPDIGVK